MVMQLIMPLFLLQHVRRVGLRSYQYGAIVDAWPMVVNMLLLFLEYISLLHLLLEHRLLFLANLLVLKVNLALVHYAIAFNEARQRFQILLLLRFLVLDYLLMQSAHGLLSGTFAGSQFEGGRSASLRCALHRTARRAAYHLWLSLPWLVYWFHC